MCNLTIQRALSTLYGKRELLIWGVEGEEEPGHSNVFGQNTGSDYIYKGKCMSSMDERQQDFAFWQQAGVGMRGERLTPAPELQNMGAFAPFASQLEEMPQRQVSFPPFPPTSGEAAAQPGTTYAPFEYRPAVTRQLPDVAPAPTTSPLADVLPGTFTVQPRTTTSLRAPVVIPATGKKKRGSVRPPKGRRAVLHLAGMAVLLLVVLGTLITVVPTSSEGKSLWSSFQPSMDVIKGQNNDPGLIAQQAATATAVTQDGYDPGGGSYFAGLPTPPPGGGGLDRFFYGQCTYWANMRYHQLTGVWVPWLGNAWQWADGAAHYGWVVSATPKLHSIIVLQPGVEGAGWYGHVAIVEQINADGSVLTSNYNWDGAWAVETFVTFRPADGVSFVWNPQM
jgi:hypothetical protein